MNSYISLDHGAGYIGMEDDSIVSLEDETMLVSQDYSLGFFSTPMKNWDPIIVRPASVKYTLNGEAYSVYGYGSNKEWDGFIIAGVAETDELSSVDTLRELLSVNDNIRFTDHYGNEYTVVSIGPFQEKHLLSDWENKNNRVFIKTRLVEVK